MTPYTQCTVISYILGRPHAHGGTWRFVWELTAPCGETYFVVFLPLDDEDAVEISNPPESLGFDTTYDIVKIAIRNLSQHIPQQEE